MTLACTITATLILIAGLFAVIVERTNERDDARENARRLESECNEHAAVSASLAQQLAELRIAGGEVIPLPRLHAVAPVSDDEWFARLYDENGNPR
jgi:hypothetical protein